MPVGIVVGNPKPASRTFDAASYVATDLTGAAPDLALDLAEYGARLLDPDDQGVKNAVAAVQGLALVVIASPTYKASYTGLLKLFLDRFAAGSLRGVTAIPLMLGAGPGHALAPDAFLRPVLSELGASSPTRSLYLLDAGWQESTVLSDWLDDARQTLQRLGVVGAAVPAERP